MPTPVNGRAAQLGARLRELRAAKYTSGAKLARQLGWIQTRVSKLETGAQLPTPDDLDAWVEATGAGAEVRAELGDLLTAARVQYAVFGDRYRRQHSIAERQAEIASGEADATILREYQPAMIPGLLQTAAYAREMLNAPGGPTLIGATTAKIDGLIRERLQRQEFLYHPDKHVQVVLGEAALWVRFGTVETLIGQLDRLVTLADLPSVDLRVLPFTVPVPAIPIAGISIEDDRAVFAETLTDEHRISDPTAIAAHLRSFETLRQAALAGTDAVRFIQRVLEDLRQR